MAYGGFLLNILPLNLGLKRLISILEVELDQFAPHLASVKQFRGFEIPSLCDLIQALEIIVVNLPFLNVTLSSYNLYHT
jgi:hypothetical protein